MLGFDRTRVYGLRKSLTRRVNVLLINSANTFDFPTKPLALVVRLGLCGQAVHLTIHRRGKESVLTLQLHGLHHAVPLAALLELRRLHDHQSRRRRAVGFDDHNIVVCRVFDVITVIEIVLVLARLAVGLRQDVARRGVDMNRCARSTSARSPLNVLAYIRAWDNRDPLLAVIQLIGDGVKDHAGQRPFDLPHFR